MKRTITLILALLIALGALPALAASSVAIDEAHFPNKAFREYIQANFDTDQNGKLSSAERKAVTQIDCYGMKINSLKGIEYFTNLKELYVDANRLKTLDLSKNTRLEQLTCNGNQLTELNLSKNKRLKRADCSNNKLKKLDLSKNTQLEALECQSNKLKTLDVSKNKRLGLLDCGNNRVKSLNLSKSTNLTELYVFDNALTKLDLSQNAKLFLVHCNGNKLSSIKFSKKNKNIGDFFCQDNPLKKLDIAGCTRLLRTLEKGKKESWDGNPSWYLEEYRIVVSPSTAIANGKKVLYKGK